MDLQIGAIDTVAQTIRNEITKQVQQGVDITQGDRIPVFSTIRLDIISDAVVTALTNTANN